MATSTLSAAVLGCGPTGLLTAYGIAFGAQQMGLRSEIRIFSAKQKSPLYGCQYLHRPIPGLNLRRERVHYRLTGKLEGYRRKVYGLEGAEDIAVSPALLDDDHYAWDIRAAYDQLWDLFEPSITNYYFSVDSWPQLKKKLDREGVDMIFTSLPAPVLCRDTSGARCTFRSQEVWAMGDAPRLGRMAWKPSETKPRTIVCSGREEDQWYRVSNVFGHHTVEWPGDIVPDPPHGASRVKKPLETSCQCNPDVIRVGRYGEWKKGVLSHTAFEKGLAVVSRTARKAKAS